MTTLEIVLDMYQLRCPNTRRAATDAFGLWADDMAKACRDERPMRLLVTAEQFGLFVALRNEYGGCNNIKALQPRVIMNPRYQRIDCTQWRIAA